MQNLRNVLYTLLCLLLILLPGAAAGEENAPGTDLVVVTTTDMHGKCWDTNLLTGGKQSSNMLRVSTAVRQIREEYGARTCC